MRSFKNLLFAASLLSLSAQSLAFDFFGDNEPENDIVKIAASRDAVSRYKLTEHNELFRIHWSGKEESISEHVADFKISPHKDDPGVMYYVQVGLDGKAHLHMLFSNAYRIESKKLTEGTALKRVHATYKYDVVPETDSSIVFTVLDETGAFKAWGNNSVIQKWPTTQDAENCTYFGIDCYHIVDYRLNKNYKQRNASHSSYVAFLLDNHGHVVKVKGHDVANSSMDRSQKYDSLDNFFRVNKIPR